MENKKLIEDPLDDCNNMEQFYTHSIYINGRILEAVDALEGEK